MRERSEVIAPAQKRRFGKLPVALKTNTTVFFVIIELTNFLHVVLFVGILKLGKVYRCSVTHMI